MYGIWDTPLYCEPLPLVQVCMMYNLQAGNTDKVISYGEKASAVMAQQQSSGEEGSSSPKVREGGMMKVLKAYVLEHIVAAKLMQGKHSEVAPLVSWRVVKSTLN